MRKRRRRRRGRRGVIKRQELDSLCTVSQEICNPEAEMGVYMQVREFLGQEVGLDRKALEKSTYNILA